MDNFIEITEEMFLSAKKEVLRREPNLNPHFTLSYLPEKDRQIIGFLGEFACCEYFGIDWRKNIRDDYDFADTFDLKIPSLRGDKIYSVDVKTETIPTPEIFKKVVTRTIEDDKPYGRRLITEFQFLNNLDNYDYVIFGAFLRPNSVSNNWSPVGLKWYLIGCISKEEIKKNYTVTKRTPFGTFYLVECVNIKTSDLKIVRKR